MSNGFTPSGNSGPIEGTSLENPVPVMVDPSGAVIWMDYAVAVSHNLIPNMEQTLKIINVITTNNNNYIVSDVPYIEQTSNAVRSIVSSSSADTQTVLLVYLTSDFEKKTQVLTLTGTTPVDTNADVCHIDDFRIIDGAECTGDLDIHAAANGAGVVIAGIKASTATRKGWYLQTAIIYIPENHLFHFAGIQVANVTDIDLIAYATRDFSSVGGGVVDTLVFQGPIGKDSNVGRDDHSHVEGPGKLVFKYNSGRVEALSLTIRGWMEDLSE